MLTVPSVFGIVKFIRRLKLKTGFIRKINLRLSSLYLTSEGMLKVLNDQTIEKQDLGLAYHTAEQNLSKYRKFYSLFERVEFFKNNTTKELCNNTLNNFYNIEAHLRMLNFADSPPPPGDKELIEMASKFSMGSLQN